MLQLICTERGKNHLTVQSVKAAKEENVVRILIIKGNLVEPLDPYEIKMISFD